MKKGLYAILLGCIPLISSYILHWLVGSIVALLPISEFFQDFVSSKVSTFSTFLLYFLFGYLLTGKYQKQLSKKEIAIIIALPMAVTMATLLPYLFDDFYNIAFFILPLIPNLLGLLLGIKIASKKTQQTKKDSLKPINRKTYHSRAVIILSNIIGVFISLGASLAGVFTLMFCDQPNMFVGCILLSGLVSGVPILCAIGSFYSWTEFDRNTGSISSRGYILMGLPYALLVIGGVFLLFVK